MSKTNKYDLPKEHQENEERSRGYNNGNYSFETKRPKDRTNLYIAAIIGIIAIAVILSIIL
jgi:hypothetical protein